MLILAAVTFTGSSALAQDALDRGTAASGQRAPEPSLEPASAVQQVATANATGREAQQAPSPASPGPAQPRRQPPADDLALRGPDIGFPGVGRVLLGFLLCAVLALGATILLRRYLPGATLLKGIAGSTDIRVLGRARVETSLRVHVIETSGTRVLIADGRNGLAVVVLPASGAEPPAAT